MSISGYVILVLAISACSEGRWMHPVKTETQALQDWDVCKTEVLAGTEFQKDTLAGGINLSGCMHSKGYRYVEDQPPKPPSPDSPTLH